MKNGTLLFLARLRCTFLGCLFAFPLVVNAWHTHSGSTPYYFILATNPAVNSATAIPLFSNVYVPKFWNGGGFGITISNIQYRVPQHNYWGYRFASSNLVTTIPPILRVATNSISSPSIHSFYSIHHYVPTNWEAKFRIYLYRDSEYTNFSFILTNVWLRQPYGLTNSATSSYLETNNLAPDLEIFTWSVCGRITNRMRLVGSAAGTNLWQLNIVPPYSSFFRTNFLTTTTNFNLSSYLLGLTVPGYEHSAIVPSNVRYILRGYASVTLTSGYTWSAFLNRFVPTSTVNLSTVTNVLLDVLRAPDYYDICYGNLGTVPELANLAGGPQAFFLPQLSLPNLPFNMSPPAAPAPANVISNILFAGSVLTLSGSIAVTSGIFTLETSSTLDFASFVPASTHTADTNGNFTVSFTPPAIVGYMETNIHPPGWYTDGGFNPYYQSFYVTNIQRVFPPRFYRLKI